MKKRLKPRRFACLLFTMAAALSGILSGCAGSGAREGVSAGMARENITPPVGGRMAGHFYERLSTGIHDSLWAKAMVLEQGGKKYAFVFCDLIGLTLPVSDSARAQASALTGIPVKNILVAAVHSHTGPLFYGFQHTYYHKKALAEHHGQDPHEKMDYPRFLARRIALAVKRADARLAPVSLQVGVATQKGLAFNRRYYMKDGHVRFNPGPLNPDIVRPAGPVDTDLGIVLIRNRQTRKWAGGLTVFAMHADCIGGSEISADYPYYLQQTLKKKFGKDFISAFAIGTCGDINDIDPKVNRPMYSEAHTAEIGRTIGETVIKTVPDLKPVTSPALAMLSTTILLPLQVPSPAQIDSARELINNLYKVRETGKYLASAGGESGNFLERVRMSKYLTLKDRKESIPAEVQVFRVDSTTALVGLPGELFVDLGLAIKKASPFKHTIILTVCNDRISYIPTRKGFREGSYEVTNSVVKPGSGEMLVSTAIKLLHQLKDDSR